MRRIICLFFFVLTGFSVNTQTPADSLVNILHTQKLTPDKQLELYMEICRLYMYSDIQKNAEYAEKGLKLAQKENNLSMASKFTELIGVTYFIKASNDTAITYLEKALEMALESKDEIQQASVYVTLGAYQAREGKDELALEYFLKALPLCDNKNGRYQYTATVGNLAAIYKRIGNTKKAFEYMEKLKIISEQENNLQEMLNAYSVLGSFHMEQKEYDKALEYEFKVLDISRKIDHKQDECGSLLAIAEIYTYGYEDYDKALIYALDSKKPINEYNDKRLLIQMWKVLSHIYRKKYDYEACNDAALHVWDMDSTNMYSADMALNIVLSNLHLGNKNKAEEFLWKFRELMYKFRDEGIHKSLANAEIKYETGEKEIRITSLEKEKKFYIWFGIAGVIVFLLALSALLYRHLLSIQKRKNAEQQHKLAEQKRELAEQVINRLEKEKLLIATQAILDGETAERSRLARDLHDGLGGLLSVIKLNLKDINMPSVLQETDVNRFNNALEMLDQSIGELRRVAHHLMPESLMRYGLKTAIDDFCHAIPYADFQYFGKDIRLDERLEIVLYRCAYELVNNAVKYAEATEIKVQLIIDENLISLTVRDDGKGFDTKNTTLSGTGLGNIRTRVSAYNGKMIIRSSPENKGTEISIEIESNN